MGERHEPDRFTRVWARIPTADRLVLLGHSRDELSGEDKVRLARIAREVARGRSGRRPTLIRG